MEKKMKNVSVTFWQLPVQVVRSLTVLFRISFAPACLFETVAAPWWNHRNALQKLQLEKHDRRNCWQRNEAAKSAGFWKFPVAGVWNLRYWSDLTVQRTIVKAVFCEIIWDCGAWRDSLTVIDQISCKSFSREIERHWESLSPMKHAIMKIDIEINQPYRKQCFSWIHRWNIVELWAWDILRHHWSFWFSSRSWERPCLECPWFHSIYCFNKDKIHIS